MTPPSGRRFCAALRRHGWTRIKTKGGHQKYRKGDVTLVVPVHGSKPLKKGLFAALLKQSGLTDADF